MKKFNLDEFSDGKFFGQFSEAVLNSNHAEVAIKRYKKGYTEKSHSHNIDSEITVVVDGLVTINGVRYGKGDIILIEPNNSINFIVLKDTIICIVKSPSHDSSKYFGVRNDYTIVVQGLIEQETYDFYFKNYHRHNVIFSTWPYCNFKHYYAPSNFKIIRGNPPKDPGQQNFNLQVASTLNGLREVKTKYAIKVRGDEYYSNLDSVIQLVIKESDKIHTAPIFFRNSEIWPYSPSDHVIAGTVENLTTMFYNASLFSSRYPHVKELGGYEKVAESMLSISYMMARLGISDPTHFTRDRATRYMRRFFGVFKLDGLKDYKIQYRDINLTWRNNFIPSMEGCIDDINLL